MLMSQLDTYRKTVTRKREELAKLSADLSKEQAKISPLQKKILLAKNAIGRTKSQTTINSKMREIEQSSERKRACHSRKEYAKRGG